MGKLSYNKDGGFSAETFKPSREKLQRFKLKMKQMFGCDLRSIAMFRVVMAACVIGDMLERMTDLRVMYTEEGIMPRSLIVSRYSSNYFLPVHLINTSWYFQLFLFNLHIVFAFLMLIGYRTKLFSTLTWFMTISLQAYNGIVGHGGDVFFRMMLFMTIFLPTQRLYSVDSATFATSQKKSTMVNSSEQNSNSIDLQEIGQVTNSGDEVSLSFTNSNNISHVSSPKIKPLTPEYSNNTYRYLSFATFAVLLQMGCMYVASYFHKTGEEWKNGEATFYAITLDYFATDFARFLVQFRESIRILTIGVAKWELLGVFFFSVPFYTDWFRLFAAFGFFSMHLGFVLCLRLGLFFWVTAGAQAINIPTPVWDMFFNWADRYFLDGKKPLRAHYNVSSPLSCHLALALKTFFILPNTASFSPLERVNSNDKISTNVENINSDDEDSSTLKEKSNLLWKNSLGMGDDWLVTVDGNGIRRSNIHALIQLCSISPLLFPFAAACNYIPANVSKYFGMIMSLIHQKTQQYQVQTHSSVSPSLYQKRKNPPKRPSVWYSRLNNIWMAFLCWFLLAYNLNTFNIHIGYKPSYNQMAYLFRLDQGWNMFSPSPPKTHWWHVIHGNLDDGTPVELFKNEGMFNFEINREINFDKPDPFYKSYGNHRWFKYWENGFNQYGADPMRLELGRYICREFNKKHHGSEMLYRFTIYFVHEFQHLNGTISSPPQHSALWDHVCYTKEE